MAVFRVDRRERRREIQGFGGRYEISDLGRVYSDGMELSLLGGRYVNLCYNGEVGRFNVAYLVARAFLPNPERRPFVIHRDSDATNNRVENLEWSEWKERCGLRPGGKALVGKGVVAYDLDLNYVGRWDSVKRASEELGVARYLITSCASGKSKRAKQYIFRYV